MIFFTLFPAFENNKSLANNSFFSLQLFLNFTLKRISFKNKNLLLDRPTQFKKICS